MKFYINFFDIAVSGCYNAGNQKRQTLKGKRLMATFVFGLNTSCMQNFLYAQFFVLPKLQNNSLGVWFILIKS